MSLLSTFFNTKAQDKNSIYPKENFSVIQAKLRNGKPVIGSINMAYKNYNKKAQYAWCLTINIGLDLKNVNENGLPLQSESDIANKFEDELIKNISKYATVHYIGHLYNDSFLDIYIYLDKPEMIDQYLKKEVNKKDVTRGFAYEIKKDVDWNIVKPYFK